MLSWAEAEWPEDYYRVLDDLEQANQAVGQAEMMLEEASDQARPFWHHQVQKRRMAVRHLEAKLREHKSNANYPNLSFDDFRMCKP